ncbi:MAG: hypothetical protein OXO50_00570 [Caldilineaceae bacterium]|nr:hypothetical protein [Caldilineaceae bacterium]
MTTKISKMELQTLKNVVRIVCAGMIIIGAYDAWTVFDRRYDEGIVDSGILHQIFFVADALGRVIIPYCFARGIMIFFNIGAK